MIEEVEQKFLNELISMEVRGIPYNNAVFNPYIMGDNLKEAFIKSNMKAISVDSENVNIEDITDVIDLRILLKEALKEDYRYLYNNIGVVCLDRPHLIALKGIVQNRPKDYYGEWSKRDINNLLNVAFLYSVIPMFNEQVKSIKKQIRHGKMYPCTNHSINDLVWRACPSFFERYAIYGIEHEGYATYVFENKYLIESYAVSLLLNISYKEAESIVKKSKIGLFIAELPMSIECEIIEYILDNAFFALTGELATKLLSYCKQYCNDEGISNEIKFSYYHEIICPQLVKFMGRLLYSIDIGKETNTLTNEDVVLDYLTLNRLCLSLKQGVELNKVTKYSKYFREQDFSFISDYFNSFIEVE